jgi:tRNA (cytidine32/guanosine34-2'-O)-methyltransferase
MGKIAKDKRDIYYRLAKQKNYRSRSAFKLLQIEDYFKIFENNKYIVDLCAAPGGWSQVASQLVDKSDGYKIISIDLQEMTQIDGVDIIVGDITRQTSLIEIMKRAEDNLIDIVMCDGAPDITGFNEFDVYIQMQLILSAINISIRMLREDGIFISKIFKGKHTNQILQILKKFFKKITIAKPKACRNASFESFLVCEGFFISDISSGLRNNELNEKDIIFLNNLWSEEEIDLEQLGIDLIQVGIDEYDSDKTYDLESTGYKMMQPVQMPINPPYKYYIDNLKGVKLNKNY